MDIPKTFFSKLGDARLVTSDGIGLIQNFIRQEYPILAKRKRMTFRVSFDPNSQVFNTVPLGKDAPLSRCCMRNIKFVFSQRIEEGGSKIYCTDPFCTKSIIDSFAATEQFIQSLFTRGINRLELPMDYGNQMYRASREALGAGG